MSNQDFAGRCALITGAASGIGACVAKMLAERGATVIGLDRQEGSGSETFPLHRLDVGDHEAVAHLCERLQGDLPRLDILVNAAGILRLGPAEDLTVEDWQACLDVNVSGVFYMLQQWIPLFKRQRSGAIVNIASNAAHVPRIGMTAYCVSKSALVSLSRCVALELAAYGVRCNMVSPGSTRTAMLAGMLGDSAGEARLVDGLPEQYKLGIPLGKLATPEDIAETVLFLASDRAGHITMQDVVIDGGATLGA